MLPPGIQCLGHVAMPHAGVTSRAVQHKPRIWETWDLFPTFPEKRDMSKGSFPW